MNIVVLTSVCSENPSWENSNDEQAQGLNWNRVWAGVAARSGSGRRGLVVGGGAIGYAGLTILKDEVHVPAVKVAISVVGVLTAVALCAQLDGSKVGDVLNRVGQRTLPIFLMFDMLIALFTWPLLRIPEFVGAPLVLTAVVVVAAMALHRLLLAMRARWLFELPGRT